MTTHEIHERESVYARRIARPVPDDRQKITRQREKEILRLPRGFTDLHAYMAMMRRLNRLKHKRAWRHWAPGGHKAYDE